MKTVPKFSRPFALLALLLLVGCPQPGAGGGSGPSIPSALWSSSPHEGALEVGALRAAAENGKTVKVAGRVKDFAGKHSVFTLVDSSLKACSDRPDDACPTPWDYCCEPADSLTANTITVEVHDGMGVPYSRSMKGEGGLDHLDRVTLMGRVSVGSDGNVTLVATSIHRP